MSDLVSRRFQYLKSSGKLNQERGDDIISRRFQKSSGTKASQDEESGIIPSFKRGMQSGVSGILAMQGEQEPRDEKWYEKGAHLVGETLSDLPAMMVGGQTGAILGIPGGPAGVTLGAGAGAFALPTLLKHAAKEYRDHAKEGEDLTFGEFLERAGRTVKETGKAAIVGGVASKMGKLLPILREMPGMSKLLNTKSGAVVARGALEASGITATQSALEGEMPTTQQFVENAALIGGMHAAGAAGKKIGLGKIIEPAIRPLVDKTSKIVSKVGKFLPESVKEAGSDIYKGISKLRKTAKQKVYFEMLEDHVGKRDAKMVESQFKWRETLADIEKSGKLSKSNLEDMMYFRQKTGNPFKKGDTYAKLAKRIPKNARKFVNETIDNHFEASLKSWNDNPATKNINPREALEKVYLPGLYEGDPKAYKRTYDEVSRKFKTKNPFAEKKTFLSYLEAFKKAGLKPRYKNIVDLMGAYDRIMIKSMANNELVQNIKKYEKVNDVDLVVNASNKENYKRAKAAGFVPFDDVYLKRYISGKKDGKPVFGTSLAPALVHPEFASAFQGVFNKNAFKPEFKPLKYYDSLANTIRFQRVALSPFHYGALMESALGAKGIKAFNIPKWLREGTELRNNKEFMMDAAQAGLKTDPVEPRVFEKGEKLIDKAIDYAGEKEIPNLTQKVLGKTKKGLEYLFKEFHPKLKLTTWNEFSNDAINKAIKEGKPPSTVEIKNIKKQMAELVNNMYGGQRWETIQHLNNPENMKWLRRAIGYPDWTTSAARQFMDAFAPGLKGKASRKYWAKYGMYFMMTQGLLKFVNSGFQQTDEENNSIKGVRWNPEKALSGLTKGDPSKWYQFPLPDFDVDIAGRTFNPGRDSLNKKLYGHFGKQMLEIGRYYTDPLSSLFSKSNPLIQIVGKQILGGTPYKRKIFPAQYAFKKGSIVPWKGAERGSLKEYAARGKEIVSDVMPFSIQGAAQRGIAPTIASLGGLFPISKGLSLTQAEPLARKAFKNKNYEEINRIRATLKDNAYSYKQIKSMIRRARK